MLVYKGPESPQSHLEVSLHGLTKLLPCLRFCLGNCQSRILLDPLVSISCLCGYTGQQGLKGLLLQLDHIPHCRCPSAGVGVAATTGTTLWPQPQFGRLDNGSMEYGPFRLNVSSFPWDMFCLRLELKFILTGDSARCFLQTLTIHLGLPGLTSILPHHQSQHATRW